MKRPRLSRVLFVLTLLLSTVGCDQVTKAVARTALTTRSYTYLGGDVQLRRVENAGGFLSLGAQLPAPARFALLTVGVGAFLALALAALFFFDRGQRGRDRALSRGTTTALTLFVAGGVGNFIDRAAKGSVTDFIFMHLGPLRTGIFNVADVAIIAGAGVLLLESFRTKTLTAQR